MDIVRVQILRFIGNSFPAFVECMLVDCHGNRHYFHDKLPVFSPDDSAVVPGAGEMRCRIIREKRDIFLIDTLLPDDIVSTNGEYQFEVYRGELLSAEQTRA